MKKLLILTAVLMMIVGAVGCRCFDRCFLGAPCGGFAQTEPYSSYPPAASCDPCQTAPIVAPGPAPYSAVPGP